VKHIVEITKEPCKMDYLERMISYFTKNQKGRDAKLFTKRPAFTSFPSPTLTVTSPDCGPTKSIVDIDHTQDGADLLPTLTWSLPPTIPSSSVAQYLIVIEDADGPIPTPALHGAFYSIPATKTSLTQEDLEKVGKENELKGGFRYAKTITGAAYGGPRPLRGHGPHRYFYQVIALGDPLGG
jgi:phosphatidylethanolamine-binding protein (PEBP) family uncharacterized protein